MQLPNLNKTGRFNRTYFPSDQDVTMFVPFDQRSCSRRSRTVLKPRTSTKTEKVSVKRNVRLHKAVKIIHKSINHGPCRVLKCFFKYHLIYVAIKKESRRQSKEAIKQLSVEHTNFAKKSISGETE